MSLKQKVSKDLPKVVITLPGLRLVGYGVYGIRNWFAITNIYRAGGDLTDYSRWVEKKFSQSPNVLCGAAKLLKLEDYNLSYM